jgi:hypothetical protein
MHGGIGRTANVFYPSTDGGFAGKEFIFLSAPASNVHAREGLDYAVFAVEDSLIQVYDKNNQVKQTLRLKANSSARLTIIENQVYRVTSTGRIMISSWTTWGFTICPSTMGGYVGHQFFANPEQLLVGSTALLILAQSKPTNVKVFDISGGTKIVEKDLMPWEEWFITIKGGPRLMVQSKEDVIVYAGSTLVPKGIPDIPAQLANGISFITVRAGYTTMIYTVTSACIFSPNSNAQVEIDGLLLTIQRGSYKEIPAGKVIMRSNATVIVQTVSNVNYRVDASTLYEPIGLQNFAVYLLPANKLELAYPPPHPSEVDFGNMIYYIVIGVVAAMVVTVILAKRGKKVRRS